MSRYPTLQGLAIPIQQLGYEVVLPERRQTSQHHLYFPRVSYSQTPISHLFRNLVDHVDTMANQAHMDLHYRYTGPVKPREGLMLDVLDEYVALNGVLNFVSEKRTNSIYQLSLEQYEQIKNRN